MGRLIVLPKYQGKGIGGALLQEIEKYFPEANRFVLFTFELFTGESSSANLYLYKKHGYKAFKKKVLNQNVSLVFLKKHL